MSTLYEQSVDTQVLIERIQEIEEGQTITYDTLSEAIGRSVTREARHNLTSARRYLEREVGIFTATINKVGIKRITHAEVVHGAPPRTKQQLRRASRRLVQTLGRTTDEKLTPEQLREKRAEMALFATIQHFTKPAVGKAVVEAIQDKQSLPIGIILDSARKAK